MYLSCLLAFSIHAAEDHQVAQPTIAVMYHPVMLKHYTGANHPERPERVSSVVNYLQSLSNFQQVLQWPEVTPADDKVIGLVHSSAYIERVKKEVQRLKPNQTAQLSTGDTILSKDSLDAARLAVGAVVQGADRIMQQQSEAAFALVRPPGHHASRNTGMGFCIFNNVAIAAKYLQEKYHLKRILIVDFDVHHGNGTQKTFDEDSSVFYFSVHQSNFYPYTGESDDIGLGAGRGTAINVPVSPGTDAHGILKAIDQQLVPAMQTFKPEFILVSAGFDSHANDLLGHLNYSDQAYAKITQKLQAIAQQAGHQRLLFALEGGYTLQNLEQSIAKILQTLVQ